MKVLIIGAAGMIGRKLTARLVRDGKLAGKAITHAHLVHRHAADAGNAPFPVRLDAFDIAASYAATKLVAPRPDVIFLLASLSRAKRRRFRQGLRHNSAEPTRYSRRSGASRRLSGGGYKPRLVFTSSIAVFGAPFPTRSVTSFSPLP